MYQKNIKRIKYILSILFFTLAFVSILKIYPQIHPLNQTNFIITKDQAEGIAKEFLNGEIPENEQEIATSFIINKELYEQRNELEDLGYSSFTQIDKYWEIGITSTKSKKSGLVLSSDSDDLTFRDKSGDWYFVRISPKGEILKLDFEKIRRTLYWNNLTTEFKPPEPSEPLLIEMQKKAYLFLDKIGVDSTKLKVISQEGKQDSLGLLFNFSFSNQLDPSFIQHEVKLSLDGTLLFYEYTIDSEKIRPSSPARESIVSIIFIILEAMVYVALFILLIYFLIQFFRKGSISFKIGLPFVYLIAGITFIITLLELWNSELPIIALGLVASTFFAAIGILFLYAISESLTRQQWADKLVVTDQYLQGGVLTADTGKVIIRGLFLGVLSLFCYVLLIYVFKNFFKSKLVIDNTIEYSSTIIFPILAFTLQFMNKAIFNEVFFRLFGLSVAKKWLKKNYLVILAGIIFSLVFSTEVKIASEPIQFIIAALPALLFSYFFVHFEIVTTIIGYFTLQTLSNAVVFSHTGEPFFYEFGIGLYFVLAILVAIGVTATLLKRDAQGTIPRFVPEYVRKLEEKERLLRELEIARHVQQRFLPKTTPQIDNYEVAALCQPAWEVGGDYYDYFKIDNDHIGIVIGDVSNKGVSAAFYMTLVKGFLKAIAIHKNNPAEILCETNALFYDNVERGHFISMIFGSINIKTGVFTFARAGHNPLLLLLSKPDADTGLTPKGVAIGILPNDQFRSATREESVQLNVGDILVLYTDGYPEAMNNKSEEFGENNLLKLIKQKSNLSPEYIILELEEKVKDWQGTRPSMDDRTIVIVKRLK